MEWIALIVLGGFAGALTTLAGLGGGLVMTLAMAAVVGPTEALATAAPALLLGNTHRVWMYRAHLEGTEPSPFLFVAGAVPGALIGGALVVALPDVVLRVLLLAAALLAFARELELFQWRPDARAAVPGAFAAGLVTATSGGGGLLLGPLLLASNIKMERFVVTASLVAGSVHVARLVPYGAGGLVSSSVLAHALVLGVAILAGNLLGRRGRACLDEKRGTQLTWLVLFVCLALSLGGFA